MSLRFLYLIFRQVLGLVLLSCRSSAAKDVELRSPPRSRRPAPHPPTAAPGLGRPGHARRARAAVAPRTASPSSGHSGHDPALASPPRASTMDLPAPDRTDTDRRPPHRLGRAHSAGEPALGIPAAAGRVAQARPPRWRLD